VLTILKAALNRAYQDGRIASDGPWKQVRPFPKADAARVRWLTKADAERLLDACAPDLRRLVMAALLTGARYGELCRAGVGDLDLNASTLCLRETKAGRPRYVPLDNEALPFLKAVAQGRGPDGLMLLCEDNRPWGKSHQVRPLMEASARAGLEPAVNFHCLRHTWASHRVMAGAPLMVVAHVLGHADTRMVEKHYGYLAPSYIRDVIRATALGLGAREEAEKVVRLRPVA
jgi:integrase